MAWSTTLKPRSALAELKRLSIRLHRVQLITRFKRLEAELEGLKIDPSALRELRVQIQKLELHTEDPFPIPVAKRKQGYLEVKRNPRSVF